ncbi:TPA: rRNA pseudouridine synthase [Streptococcus equi subsp. zooepidemicus]|uniref:pseudouridine synthase n=1 Tax=Streptococcus equi TaxID=1336 RepID=UPI00294A9BA0|nr:pseudouridine synthase [Streptococcus equi]WOK56546.1 pseudouridine synthase [Streptococcus equi subsp. zooepidemicus]HEL1074837.1 rRNA pseudouridine synthase [Streptococcus equi subsp. zooepidemicus]
MRLDKFLVDAGLGSRSQVKLLLKKKQVSVNGVSQTSSKYQVNEMTDEVSYQGQRLNYEAFVYYMLNKPKGVISATEDSSHKTVLDLLDDTARQKAVFPVGRLDKDTHGLLLVTNDGKLAHALLSPKKHVAKQYLAVVDGMMTQEDVKHFAQGITLKDHQCMPAHLDILEINESLKTSLVKITIEEGKFHQVKRMVAACGKTVSDLQRISMGPLQLDSALAPGAYRRLTAAELEALKA